MRFTELLIIGVEAAIGCWVALRVRRAIRASRAADTGAELDVPERIDAVLADLVPSPRIAAALGTELSILYFALLGWRRGPHVPPGMRPLSYHRKGGLVALLVTLFLAAVVELVAVHFLVRIWSVRVAWTLTILSAVGAVWLLGVLRAVILRPHLVDPAAGVLHVRVGVQWRTQVPLGGIARAEVGRLKPMPRSAAYLRAYMLSQPNALLTLAEPVMARGMYGRSRSVEKIALALDEPRLLERALDAESLGEPAKL